MRTLIRRDYPTFSGIALERYFREKAIASKRYTMIGRWWDRKGQNEIDMIAANELEKTAVFCEIKRNRKNIDLALLEEKVKRMQESSGLFNDYELRLKGLDMADM